MKNDIIETRNTKHETRNTKHETRNTKHETRKLEDLKSVPELTGIKNDNIFRKIYRTVLPLSLRKKFRAADSSIIQSIFKKSDKRYSKGNVNKIRFEIQLAEHCNLNCKSCSHFSPIAEPEFLSVEEFERDFKRLGEIVNHECDEIRLMGGEPLLNPEIIKMLKIARKNFTDGVIDIVTNGILLAQMSEEFWRTCHDYKIYIEISHYPINIQEDKIKELADKFGVTCFWVNMNLKTEFTVCAIDLEGKQDIKNNFNNLCGEATNCPNLSHGKMYPCPFAAYVHHFNKKFNKNIQVTEADYIDIHSNINKLKLLKKITSPVPVCRFCNIAGRRMTGWEVSKQDISEWQ